MGKGRIKKVALTNHRSAQMELLVFLLAFAARSFVLACVLKNSSGSELRPDSTEYIRLAHNLIEHGVFQVIKRGPVYPAFLAFMLFVFKAYYVQAVVVIQVLLDSLTAVIVCKAAGHLVSGRRAAAASGVIYALCPVCITSTGLIMTETIFSFLFAAAFYCFLKCLRDGGTKSAVASGLLFGIAMLTRSVLTPLFFLIVPFLFFARRDVSSVKNAVLLACGIAIVVSPWALRNYLYYGSPVITNIVDYNLYCFEAPAADYVAEKGITSGLLGKNAYQEMAVFIQNEWRRNAAAFNCLWTEEAKNPKENRRVLLERLGRESKEKIRRNSGGVLALHLIGVWQTLRPSSGAHIVVRLWGRSDSAAGSVIKIFRAIDFFAFIFFLIGSAAVLSGLISRRLPAVWALIAATVFYMSFTPGGQAYFRFRIPIQFLISVMVSLGIMQSAALLMRNTALSPLFHKKGRK